MSDQKSIFEKLVDAVEAEFADNTVPFKVREKSLHDHSTPRRAVWVWVGGSVTGAASPGGQLIQGQDGAPDRRIEVLGQNVANVELHLCAEDQGTLELLWVKMLNTIKRCFGTGSVSGDYEMVTETEKSGHIYGDAAAMVQLFAWNMDIVKVIPNTNEDLSDMDEAVTGCIIDNNLVT